MIPVSRITLDIWPKVSNTNLGRGIASVRTGTMPPIVKNAKPSVSRMLRWLTQNKFFEGVVLILGIGSIGLGLTFLVTPEAYFMSPSFQFAFHTVSPVVWGLSYIISAAFLLLTALRPATRNQGMWPGSALVLTHLGMAICFLLSMGQGGVPSGVWVYLTLGVLSVWVVAGCAFISYPSNPHDER